MIKKAFTPLFSFSKVQLEFKSLPFLLSRNNDNLLLSITSEKSKTELAKQDLSKLDLYNKYQLTIENDLSLEELKAKIESLGDNEFSKLRFLNIDLNQISAKTKIS